MNRRLNYGYGTVEGVLGRPVDNLTELKPMYPSVISSDRCGLMQDVISQSMPITTSTTEAAKERGLFK